MANNPKTPTSLSKLMLGLQKRFPSLPFSDLGKHHPYDEALDKSVFHSTVVSCVSPLVSRAMNNLILQSVVKLHSYKLPNHASALMQLYRNQVYTMPKGNFMHYSFKCFAQISQENYDFICREALNDTEDFNPDVKQYVVLIYNMCLLHSSLMMSKEIVRLDKTNEDLDIMSKYIVDTCANFSESYSQEIYAGDLKRLHISLCCEISSLITEVSNTIQELQAVQLPHIAHAQRLLSTIRNNVSVYNVYGPIKFQAGVIETLSSIPDTINRVATISTELEALIQDNRESFTKTMSLGGSISDFFNKISEDPASTLLTTLGITMENAKKYAPIVIPILCALGFGYYLQGEDVDLDVITKVLMLAGATYGCHKIVDGFVDYMNRLDDVREQAGEQYAPIVNLLLGALRFTMSSKSNVSDKIMDVLKLPLKSGEFVVTMFNGALKIIEILRGGVDPFEGSITGNVDYDEFVNAKNRILELGDNVVVDGPLLKSIKDMINIGEKLRVTQHVLSPAMSSSAAVATEQLRKLYKELSLRYKPGGISRIEPAVYGLVSGPGVGKSTAMRLMNDRFVRYLFRDRITALEHYNNNPSEYVYNRPNTQHWEGITRHNEVVTYNDLFAAKTVAGSDFKPELEFIDLVDGGEYLLTMAGVDKKGGYFARPSLVAFTTNQMSIPGEQLRTKDAFARRVMPAMFRVEWGDGRRPKLDEPITTKEYRFCPQTFDKNGWQDADVPPLTFDEVFVLLVDQYESNKKKYASLQAETAVPKQALTSDEALEVIRKKFRESRGKNPLELLTAIKRMNLFNENTTQQATGDDIVFDADEVQLTSTLWHYAHLLNVQNYDTIDQVPMELALCLKMFANDIGEAKLGETDPQTITPNRLKLEYDVTMIRDFEAVCELFLAHVDQKAPRLSSQQEIEFMKLVNEVDPSTASMYTNRFHVPFELLSERAQIYLVEMSEKWTKEGNCQTPQTAYDHFRLKKGMMFAYIGLNTTFRPLPVAVRIKVETKMMSNYFTQIAKELYSKTWSILSEMYDTFKMILKFAIPLFIATRLIEWVFAKRGKKAKTTRISQPTQAEYNPTPMPRGGNSKRPNIKRVKDYMNNSSDVVLQANTAVMQALTLSTKAQWAVTCGSPNPICYATGIVDHMFLINCHSIATIVETAIERDVEPNDVELTFTNKNMSFKVLLGEIFARSSKSEMRDLLIFEALKSPMQSDIRTQWADDKFIMGYLSDMRRRFAGFINTNGVPQYFGNAFGLSHYECEGYEGVVTRHGGVTYIANSFNGYCGSHVGITDSSQGNLGKLIGIHAAGNNGFGPCYAALITKTDMARMIAQIKGEFKLGADKKIIIGEVEPKASTFVKGNSVLVPSVKPMKEPIQAQVHVNDPVVYEMARAKYTRTFEPSDQALEDYKVCSDATFADLASFAQAPFVPRTYGFEESIFGEHGSKFKPLDLHTSAGFPFSARSQTKRDLIGYWEGAEFVWGKDVESTKADLTHYLQQLANGHVPPTVFTDNVKYETLPKEKVLKGKGRMVSASNLIRVLACRMLFGPFCEWLMSEHLTNEIALGDNLLGPDADYIARLHLEMGQGCDVSSAGDYSAFDASHHIKLIGVTMDNIVKFCNDGSVYDECRRVFALSYQGTFHVRGDMMDIMVSGLSSGDPMTSIINSLMNKTNIRYVAYVGSGRDPSVLVHFMSNVFLRVLGDDNNFTVRPSWAELLNEESCATYLPTLGYTYTNDAKDGITIGTRPYNKTTFLKRGSRFEPVLGRYVAPLDLNVILEIALWTRSEGKDKKPSIDMACANADSCMRELCYHDQEVWDEWLPKLKAMYAQHNWAPITESRSFMLKYVQADYL